jgi:hypothetical protein
VAYAANQLSRLGPGDSTYGVLNVAGAAMLAVAAVISAVWGFVVLEGTWAVVSLVALIRLTQRRATRLPAEGGEPPGADTPDRPQAAERNDVPPTSGVQR